MNSFDPRLRIFFTPYPMGKTCLGLSIPYVRPSDRLLAKECKQNETKNIGDISIRGGSMISGEGREYN